MNDPRIRRALLFIPGDSERKLAKGATLTVDTVILDLEDSVDPAHKVGARAIVRQALASGQFASPQTERLVRVNADRSRVQPMQADDILATMPGKPDGYVLPKVESAHDIVRAAALLQEQEQALGIDIGRTKILAIIETARGVVNLREIAGAHDRLVALLFGAEDLAADMGAVRSADGAEAQYARSALVVHAAAFGLQAIDTPFIKLDDMDGLHAEAGKAMRMGFSGKLAIHPAQIAPIIEVFNPSDDEIAAAQQLMDAYRAHAARGAGVFVHDGKMVDMPVIRAAERILVRASAAGKL